MTMSTNTYLQAADDALRLLRGFAAVKEVAEAFAQVGTLKQAADEAEAQLAEAQAKIEVAKREVDEARTLSESARGEAAALIADANEKAANIVETSREAADTELRKARAECDELRKDAADHVAAANATVLELAAQRDAIKQETEDLEARLLRARSKAAELLGG